MGSSVIDLLEAAGLTHAGAVAWTKPTPLDAPGVYVVSLDHDPHARLSGSNDAPISRDRVAELLDRRPELRLDGARPSPAALAQRLAACWLPDEPVIYVGLASASVRDRVTAYYRTKIGARSPHAGGWPLKMLKDIERVQVHFASASDPRAAEIAMLNAFCAGVSDASRARLHDPERPLPFGNLDWPGHGRKLHGISGAKEPRKAASLPAPSKPATPSPRAATTGTTPDHRTQRVTEADLRAGRIRIPIVGGTKALLPNAKANLTVTLRGREMEARYDPRRGPDRERSGILSFGTGAGLGRVIAPNEVLRVAVIDATTLDLT